MIFNDFYLSFRVNFLDILKGCKGFIGWRLCKKYWRLSTGGKVAVGECNRGWTDTAWSKVSISAYVALIQTCYEEISAVPACKNG